MNKNNIISYSCSSDYEHQCRICLETVSCRDLISPCRCIGSISYVHENCLKTWITSKNENLSDAKCELCNTIFHMNWETKNECIYHTLVRQKSTKTLLFPALLIYEILTCYILVNILQRFSDENNIVGKVVLLVLVVLATIGFVFIMYVLVISVKNLYITKVVKNWRINNYRTTVDFSLDNKESSSNVYLVTYRYGYLRSNPLAEE